MDHASLKGGMQELEIMIQNTKWTTKQSNKQKQKAK